MVIVPEARAILGLPFLTGFLASEAKSIGVFGLVAGGITILYHTSDLSLGRPQDTFTNTYHLAMRTDYRLL